MQSQKLATWAISQIHSLGIRELIVCGGARNAPLVCAMEDPKFSFRVKSFYNENSAAFYALGRAKLGIKTAVICTSGTAVAQFLPACIEAFYDSRFILFITADRPKMYRFTGAPQCIDQTNILKDFCSLSLDLESIPEEESFSLARSLPAHLNLCFDEPLWWTQDAAKEVVYNSNLFWAKSDCLPTDQDCALELIHSLKAEDLLVVSRVGLEHREFLVNLLDSTQATIYLEASASLGKTSLKSKRVLLSGEAVCSKLLDQGSVKRVVRLGGVPCLRLWRDLDGKYKNIPSFSIDESIYSGAVNVKHYRVDFEKLSRNFIPFEELAQESLAIKGDRVAKIDGERLKDLKHLMEKFPGSEVSLLGQLSKQITIRDSILLGNSMSIRQWDLINFPQVGAFYCNRGVNGIDGQLSSFLGAVDSSLDRHIAIVGDLTFMYDLSWAWAYKYIESKCSIVFVMNNHGAKIFERVFPSEWMLNRHEQNFEFLAKQYSLNYLAWDTIGILPNEGHWLIELNADSEQNLSFWKALDKV